MEKAHAGRPPDENLTPVILRAAQEEIAAAGVTGFSVRAVARRAGVSRKAIAARWPDSHALTLAALGVKGPISPRPTGDVRDDLLRLGTMIAAGLASSDLDVQLRVAADAGLHPDALAELQASALHPTKRALVKAFDQLPPTGSTHGEESEWRALAFVGALFMKTISNPGRAPVTSKDVAALVDSML